MTAPWCPLFREPKFRPRQCDRECRSYCKAQNQLAGQLHDLVMTHRYAWKDPHQHTYTYEVLRPIWKRLQ